MADATVSVVFEGDDAKLANVLGKVAQRIAVITTDLRKMKKEGVKAGKETGKELEGAGKQGDKAFGKEALTRLKGFATGLLGIGTAAAATLAAFKLVTAETANIKDLQESAASSQVTVSGARQELIRNLGGFSASEIRRVIRGGESISAATGVSQVPIFRGLAQGVSASGGDINLALAAAGQAARFLADSPEDIAQFQGALIDLSKVTGSKVPRVNLGFQQLIGQFSRVVDPKFQARQIPRALIGTQAFGGTAVGAGSLFAALSVGGADITGAPSATGTISLAKQLSEFLPERRTAEREAKDAKQLADLLAAGKKAPKLDSKEATAVAGRARSTPAR